MEVYFRRAEFPDVPELLKVQNQSFYGDFIRYGHCPSFGETEEAMLRYISNNIVYKIERDGEIIGDMIIRRKDDGRYYLRVIAIIPRYWNSGIGQKALRFLEKEYPDAAGWDLITPGDNSRNHHFYEKLGFCKTGEKKDPDGMLLWIYQKELKSAS